MSKEDKNIPDHKEILLPDASKLIVSSSPHLHDSGQVAKIMREVALAMLPLVVAAIWVFGLPAVRVLLLCTAFCLSFELISLKLLGKSLKPATDFSAVITGMLLAMNLDANAPWWICLIGSFIAIVVAKQLFGGLGYNPFNPALVARVGLLIGFPDIMTVWSPTTAAQKVSTIDAQSLATPLEIASQSTAAGKELLWDNYFDLFTGNISGCLGETSALAILVGGGYLILRRIIWWQIPFFYILTVAIITGLVNNFVPMATPDALFHILTGGLMIGAFFMATDMQTTPVTRKGGAIFAIGCGVITSVIRIWGAYPEGVSFAILFMNAFTPLIDKMTRVKPFGFWQGESK